LEEALYCIRCGACLNACPVFREIGGHAYVGRSGRITPYSGPIGSVVSPGLFGIPEFGHLARASSLCGACKEACPVDIDLPKLLLRVRAGKGTSASVQSPAHVPPSLNIGLRLFSWAAASAGRFSLAQRMAGFFSRLFSPFSSWLRLPAWSGWGYGRDFPRPAARPFRAQFTQYLTETVPVSLPTPKASLFPSPASVLPPSSVGDLRARFEAELTSLGGSFTLCSEDDLPQRVSVQLQERGIDAIQAWDAAHLPPGLLTALQAKGIQIHLQPDPRLRAGLTGAAAGLAETGTLVLPAGPGRPLTASLLPEMHIAILHAGDICANLAQLGGRLDQLRSEAGGSSSVVLISGPSRTADIEMTLTIGVHGPGELHVFCLEN
jgi:L-lactate dehydrogenase complex protein LldF